MTRTKRVEKFRSLHVPGDPFVMLNPWDVGSAKLLAAQGAKALGTTSVGHSFTLGVPDGMVGRSAALAHARHLCAEVDLPISADFENGFGDDPEQVATTVMLSAEVGLAGISIEDTDPVGGRSYDFDLAVARIEAAVEAARYAGIVLSARADGWMMGTYEESEAVRRCHAFASVGADVIYAPLVGIDALMELTATGTPVNALASRPMAHLGREAYAEMGVARISVGGGLSRLIQASLIEAGEAMLGRGDFRCLSVAATEDEVDTMLEGGRALKCF